MLTLTLPLTITIPRKTKEDKVFILNLNHYRNTHHMTLNQAKVAYKQAVEEALTKAEGVLPEAPYKFTYAVFPATKRAFDLGNVLPVVQKFCDDALIETGVLADDNYKVVAGIEYRFGKVDPERPRAELQIESMHT